MTTPSNGHIRLTWGQITWAIALLVAALGGWFDMRFQVRGVSDAVVSLTQRLTRLERRGSTEHAETLEAIEETGEETVVETRTARARLERQVRELEAEVERLRKERDRSGRK